MKDQRNNSLRQEKQDALAHLISDKWVAKERIRSKTTTLRWRQCKLQNIFKKGVINEPS